MIKIRFKRGTAEQLDALTLSMGVLAIDSENHQLRVHDGQTQGGHAMGGLSDYRTVQDALDALGIADIDGLELALAAKIAIAELGQPEGVAHLNPEGVVPTEQLPSWVEEILEVEDLESLPNEGEVGKLYIVKDSNELYRWSGSQSTYYQISGALETSDDLSQGQINFFYTDVAMREALGAEGSLTYDSATGVFGYTRSVVSVNGQGGDLTVTAADLELGAVENFTVATETEARVAVETERYVTPALTRSFAESLGFTDAEGYWTFSEQFLADLGLRGLWAQLTNGPTSVTTHTAVAISGKMYVYGGYDGRNRLNDLWVYDPTSDSWSQLTNGPASLSAHKAVAINGKMYVYGGSDGSVRRNWLYEYDPATDTWTRLTNGHASLTDHTAVTINDKMYVYGGFNGARYKNLYEYDPATDNWTRPTSGPVAFYGHTAVAINDKMYVYGGRTSSNINTLFEYDPATNNWSNLPNGPVAIHGHTAVAINDKMYVYGGRTASNTSSSLNSLYEYDPVADTWTQLTDGLAAFYDHTAVVIDNKIYVYGGNDGSVRLNTLYVVE